MPTGIELVGSNALPQHFDWRDVNGRNWVLPDVNQHIPAFCGSCWIHGTVAQLNDRINILRGGKWPYVMLARQSLLNCVRGENNTEPPGCYGGDSWLVYKHMKHTKVPDETCNTWKAVNQKCEPKNICSNCAAPAGYEALAQEHIPLTKFIEQTSKFDYTAGCKPLTGFIGYQVSDYGSVSGEADMMKEIYARGPISCTLGASNLMAGFESNPGVLKEGVFVQDLRPGIDHSVEVAGWGETASGLKYWAIRNSWGTYWGEAGWFRLRRGVDQSSIEKDCNWAVPTFDDMNLELQGKVMGDFARGIHKVDKPVDPSIHEDIPTIAASEQTAVQPWSSGALIPAICTAASMVFGIVGFTLGRASRPKEVELRQPEYTLLG